MENCSLGNICPRDRRNIWKQSVSYMNSRSTCAITVPTACLTLVERFREHESHYLSRILPWLWQARSFGAKRQQAETLTSPRLLLDGAFPIPPVTQISSVAARCAIAIFPRAAARGSAGSVRSAPADRRRSPCGSAAPASAPAPGGTRRRPPFSLPAALQILRSGS